jgi:hypothetical protein
MWYKIVLLILCLFWLGGCLALFTAKQSPTASSTPRRVESDVRTEEVPTPRLFGVDLDLSFP